MDTSAELKSHPWLKLFTVMSISASLFFLLIGLALVFVSPLAGLGLLLLGCVTIAASIHTLRVTDYLKHWRSELSRRDRIIGYIAIFIGPISYIPYLLGLPIAVVVSPTDENAVGRIVSADLIILTPVLLVWFFVNSREKKLLRHQLNDGAPLTVASTQPNITTAENLSVTIPVVQQVPIKTQASASVVQQAPTQTQASVIKMPRGFFFLIAILYIISIGLGLLQLSAISDNPVVLGGGVYIEYSCFAVIAIFFIFAGFLRIRENRYMSSGILLLLGSIPVVIIILMQTWYTSYQSSCLSRISPGAVLKGCDFSEQNLSNTNLAGANLTQASLENADLTDAILDGATFEHTNLVGVIGLSDEKLAAILNVTVDKLSATLKQHDVIVEYAPDIHGKLENVCSGQSVLGTHTYIASEDFHPMVIFWPNGNIHDESERFGPPGLRFTELVACIGVKQALPETAIECRYTNGAIVTIYQSQVVVRILTTKTGSLVAEKTITSAKPSCVKKERNPITEKISMFISDEEIERETIPWLTHYVNPP